MFQKVVQQTHGGNFVKSELIFKIHSSLKRELNSQQNPCNIVHHTLSMFPHYLGKVNSSNFESKYHILRCDRKVGRGGGVCAFIRRSFRIMSNSLVGFADGFEILSFDILDFYVPYRILVVYRPPTSCVHSANAATEVMSQLISCLEGNISHAGITVICGDFNCPDIEWQLNQCPSDICQKMLCEFAVFNGFTQCTPEPTRSGNLLDLVLVSDPLAVSDITVAPPFSTSDHNLVDVSFLYTAFVPNFIG